MYLRLMAMALMMFSLSTHNNAPNTQWDGRTASGVVVTDGVYYYLIKGKGLDGKTYEKTGYIHVIR
jgi:flagellar hook assembly protein FlgD